MSSVGKPATHKLREWEEAVRHVNRETTMTSQLVSTSICCSISMVHDDGILTHIYTIGRNNVFFLHGLGQNHTEEAFILHNHTKKKIIITRIYTDFTNCTKI